MNTTLTAHVRVSRMIQRLTESAARTTGAGRNGAVDVTVRVQGAAHADGSFSILSVREVDPLVIRTQVLDGDSMQTVTARVFPRAEFSLTAEERAEALEALTRAARYACTTK